MYCFFKTVKTLCVCVCVCVCVCMCMCVCVYVCVCVCVCKYGCGKVTDWNYLYLQKESNLLFLIFIRKKQKINHASVIASEHH